MQDPSVSKVSWDNDHSMPRERLWRGHRPRPEVRLWSCNQESPMVQSPPCFPRGTTPRSLEELEDAIPTAPTHLPPRTLCSRSPPAVSRHCRTSHRILFVLIIAQWQTLTTLDGASRAMQKLNLSTTFAVNAHNVLLQALPQ